MAEKVTRDGIRDDDRLLRRVPYLDPNFIKEDGSLASPCFTPRNGEQGLSVDVERLTSYPKAIRDRTRYRLYYLVASFVYGQGLNCQHDPTPDNYAHALIMGSVSKPLARKLAAAARRISWPEKQTLM